MKVIQEKTISSRVRIVKDLIESAGHKMFGVSFIKRSDGKKRKICARLHVHKPTYAMTPTGKSFKKRKSQDSDKMLITVFDTNAVRYNSKNRMSGRGEWKSIPLDGVTRICVGGCIYKIIR